jgi:hypothetical protein
MKKIVLLTGIIFSCIYSECQTPPETDTVNINLLNAPVNPAFNLMGLSPAEIDRPTDLNSFQLSVLTATNGFTQLPTNYAVELSPAAIFTPHTQTLKNLAIGDFGNTLWQSLSISAAISRSDKEDKETADENSFTKLGFGLKVSLIKNKAKYIDSFYYQLNKTKEEYTKLYKKHFDFDKRLQEIEKKMEDKTTPDSQIEQLNAERTQRRNAIFKKIKDDSTTALNEYAAKFKEFTKERLKFDRQGGFLDFATGIALDFPDNRFNYSLVSKAGAWLTGGYDNSRKGISALGIARVLFQPDKIFADDNGTLNSKDITTFDIGGKLAVTAMKGKFSFNTEYIRRAVLTKNSIPSSWRLVFNTEYDVGFNQKLTLSLGRNFDGTITKDGNIIAAINFIKGFGSSKKADKPLQ